MKLPVFAVFSLHLLAAAAQAQTLPEEFRKEWPDFRYLEPKQLRQLPAPVRADLESRGCRIPMFTKWDGPHNAIAGQFLEAGRQDWAVLCASDGKTAILVYPGGTADAVQPLRTEASDPRRLLHPVSAFVLTKRALRDQQGEQPVQPFDHDAIEDGPIGMPGRVIYHRAGEWMLL
ncbi:MAG TPA: hypothetical protein VHA15_05595 [Burkholderiales bacterium]|jgi:hypothetical protein|nr:hypothetical protein [Burkholderiales bacterium]